MICVATEIRLHTKMTKRKQRVASKKLFGLDTEPDFPIRSEFDLGKALSWYAAMPETDNFEWIENYLELQGRSPDFVKSVSINKKHLPGTFFAIARMCSREMDIPTRVIKNLDAKLEAIAAMPVATPIAKPKKIYSSVLERTMADIDMADDLLSVISFDCTISMAIPTLTKDDKEILQTRYRLLCTELQSALKGDVPDLKDAYRNHSTASLVRRINFLQTIIGDARPQEKPAKKVIIPSLHIKKYGDWASLDPQKFCNKASTLIAVKPYTKQVLVYIAVKGSKLDISSGGKFLNVDKKKSFSVVADNIAFVKTMDKIEIFPKLTSMHKTNVVDARVTSDLLFARAFG